jgi:hypothetical protein
MGCRECHGGEASAKDVPSGCAMCHDFHMDQGAPSMLIRQRVRGKRQDTDVIASARPGGSPRAVRLAAAQAAEGKR